jgi:hypothetical protein
MYRGLAITTFGAAAILAACDQPPTTAPDIEVQFAHVAGHAMASGGGHYVLSDVFPGTFAFTAIQTSSDGAAKGHLRHTLVFNGELIEFHGEVTCLTVDRVNGRAWIGGEVTRNKSVAEPYASDARFQPGQDIWFRVLDNGQGQSSPDRTTFTGFMGDAGFDTSVAYCAGMPWPADDARTHPVSAGNIQVK